MHFKSKNLEACNFIKSHSSSLICDVISYIVSFNNNEYIFIDYLHVLNKHGKSCSDETKFCFLVRIVLSRGGAYLSEKKKEKSKKNRGRLEPFELQLLSNAVHEGIFI